MSKTLNVRKFTENHAAYAYKNVCLIPEQTFTQLFPKVPSSEGTVSLVSTDGRHTFFYKVLKRRDIKEEAPDQLDIYLNGAQRNNLGVKPGDTVQCRVGSIPCQTATSVTFSVSMLAKAGRRKPASGPKLKINGPEIDEIIKANFLSHILTEGQAIAIEASGQTLQIVVSNYEAEVPIHALSEAEALMKQNMRQDDSAEQRPPFVILGAETAIEYKSTESVQVVTPYKGYVSFFLYSLLFVVIEWISSRKESQPESWVLVACLIS